MYCASQKNTHIHVNDIEHNRTALQLSVFSHVDVWAKMITSLSSSFVWFVGATSCDTWCLIFHGFFCMPNFSLSQPLDWSFSLHRRPVLHVLVVLTPLGVHGFDAGVGLPHCNPVKHHHHYHHQKQLAMVSMSSASEGPLRGTPRRTRGFYGFSLFCHGWFSC